MTRKDLRKIYSLSKEIEDLSNDIKVWKNRLDRIQYRAEGKDGIKIRCGSRSLNKVLESDVEINKRRINTIIEGKSEEIQILLKEMQIEEQMIKEYIDTIEDDHIRKVVELRSIECMKWEQIADEIGGSGDGHRMAYNRFLNRK